MMWLGPRPQTGRTQNTSLTSIVDLFCDFGQVAYKAWFSQAPTLKLKSMGGALPRSRAAIWVSVNKAHIFLYASSFPFLSKKHSPFCTMFWIDRFKKCYIDTSYYVLHTSLFCSYWRSILALFNSLQPPMALFFSNFIQHILTNVVLIFSKSG